MNKKAIAQITLACVGLPFLFFLLWTLGIFVFTGVEVTNMAPRVISSLLVSFVTGMSLLIVTCEMRNN